MGVRGLTTFIENYFDAWLKCEPKGGMVFDGYSLFFTLFLCSDIDWVHGGEYWLFRDILLEFFGSLKTSGIQAIVIMDGVECEKNAVVLERMNGTIEAIHSEMIKQQLEEEEDEEEEEDCEISALPILTREVFASVLAEIDVPFYVVDGEADPITVAFANHYHCPVVSNDSDYFMFNVDYGYIPLDRLNWDSQPVTAEMYKLTTFNQIFEIKNLHLSRAIPAILGNDYIKGQMGLFIRQGIISLAKFNGYQVASLIRYISKVESVDQLLAHMERTLDNGQAIAKSILESIQKAEEFYDVTTMSKEDIMSNSVLVSTKSKKIPWWIIQQYRQGQFHTDLMRALISGECFYGVAAEDPYKPTSYRASTSIRQSIYSLLSPLIKENAITEMIRKTNTAVLAPEEVNIIPSSTFPSPYSMNKVSHTNKVSVLCEMIGVGREVLDRFDEEWKLVVAAACYWVKECIPSHNLIKALVMCFLYCSNLKNTNDRELLACLPNMRRTVAWMDALHMFSYFQCIYLDVMRANNVLQNPLIFVSPAFFFSGKFVQMYACTDDLHELVDKELVPSPLYKKLLGTLTSFVPH